MKILDSGYRREFESGAVRDIQKGKGRCDLLPLDVIGTVMHDTVLCALGEFQRTGDIAFLYTALREAVKEIYTSYAHAALEISKHFEDGAKKYGDNNWRLGIPAKCFLDSGVRHYLKYCEGLEDEPHDRATIWNIVCAIWTCENKPELNNYGKGQDDEGI